MEIAVFVAPVLIYVVVALVSAHLVLRPIRALEQDLRLFERAERLGRVSRAERQALERVRAVIQESNAELIRAGRRQAWFFFALGLLASVPVGIMVNYID
ncbi:hypothetical protein [Acrocarpospora phusangensis]|uniref:hypothetical protein n=1 Tax=Acrocarpospora phusangensis TaxID=1070424 RepID=UPI0019509FCE|nr:hypothetical protein [Acrocarpospora phusangensis]